MTELDGTLSELARLQSGSEPIVSLYLDMRWSDEHQRERVRLFVQERDRAALGHYLPESPGRDGLERTLERMHDHVGGLVGQAYEADEDGARAVRVRERWACGGRSSSRGRSQNELGVDAHPAPHQLARLADDVAPAIVVVPSQEGADIYHVALGELDGRGEPARLRPARGRQESFNAGHRGPPAPPVRAGGEERAARQETFVQKNLRARPRQVHGSLRPAPGERRSCSSGRARSSPAFERELPERVRHAGHRAAAPPARVGVERRRPARRRRRRGRRRRSCTSASAGTRRRWWTRSSARRCAAASA